MATIERYEDIRGWQRARELTNFVYKGTKYKTRNSKLETLNPNGEV